MRPRGLLDCPPTKNGWSLVIGQADTTPRCGITAMERMADALKDALSPDLE